MYFKNNTDRNVYVMHIANSMVSRKNIGLSDIDKIHNYPYGVLYDKSFEETSTIEKIRGVYRVLKREKPTHVLVFGINDVSFLFVILWAKLFGKKLIITANTTEFDKERSKITTILKSYILNCADKVLCYGNLHRKYLLSLGLKPNKIGIRIQATNNQFIRNKLKEAHNLSFSPISKYGDYLLFVGRLIPEKNLEFLLRVFNKVDNQLNLVIIGDGILKEKLNELNNQLKNKNVFFVGPMKLDDIVLYYKDAKALVLPSVSETWGLVANEAMLCKLPILVSSHCGCSLDLIKEGVNGYIFDPYNEEYLVDILNNFPNDNELKKMGLESEKIINSYTTKIAADQMMNEIIDC